MKERVWQLWRQQSQIIYIMISKTQKTIKQFVADLVLEENLLSITLKSSNEDYTLSTELRNDNLPSSFINIFDTVSDVYNFIREVPSCNIDLIGNTLKLMVKVVRVRDVIIELTRNEISRQEVLERRLDKLEKNQPLPITTITLQRETQRLLEEFAKKNIKPLTDQVKRLAEKVATLEEKTRQLDIKCRPQQNIFSQPAASSLSSALFSTLPKQQKRAPQTQPQELTKKIFESTQNKQAGVETNNVTLQRVDSTFDRLEGQVISAPSPPKAKDFTFEIDINNKYLSDYFIINNSRVTRKVENEEIYMFSSSNPIPATERHCLKIRIDKITEGLIWVGILAENKKQEQYIGEETGIMQFSLEGNKVIIDGKGYTVSVPEFKDGQVLSMEVEISTRKLRFYRNGKPNPLVKLVIPESMAGCKLYPYVQLINEGDSITFI